MNKLIKSLPSMILGTAVALVATNSLGASMDKAGFYVGIVGGASSWNKKTRDATAGVLQKTQPATGAVDGEKTTYKIVGDNADSTSLEEIPKGTTGGKFYILPNLEDAGGDKGETLDKLLLGVGLCAGLSYPLTDDFYVGLDAGFTYNPGKTNNQKVLFKGQYIDGTTGTTGELKDFEEGLVGLKNRFNGYCDLVLGHRKGFFAFFGGTYSNVQSINNASGAASDSLEAVITGQNLWGMELGVGVRAMLSTNLSLTLSAGYNANLSEPAFSWSYGGNSQAKLISARAVGGHPSALEVPVYAVAVRQGTAAAGGQAGAKPFVRVVSKELKLGSFWKAADVPPVGAVPAPADSGTAVEQRGETVAAVWVPSTGKVYATDTTNHTVLQAAGGTAGTYEYDATGDVKVTAAQLAAGGLIYELFPEGGSVALARALDTAEAKSKLSSCFVRVSACLHF